MKDRGSNSLADLKDRGNDSLAVLKDRRSDSLAVPGIEGGTGEVYWAREERARSPGDE